MLMESKDNTLMQLKKLTMQWYKRILRLPGSIFKRLFPLNLQKNILNNNYKDYLPKSKTISFGFRI